MRVIGGETGTRAVDVLRHALLSGSRAATGIRSCADLEPEISLKQAYYFVTAEIYVLDNCFRDVIARRYLAAHVDHGVRKIPRWPGNFSVT
jgi:hypothetical protein